MSWKKDFDLSQLNFIDLVKNSEIIANNLLQKAGAYLGIIYQQFGIASFLIPFFLFITGLKFSRINTLLNLSDYF